MASELISPTLWQWVSVPNGTGLYRLSVPGGWLVLIELDVMHQTEDRGLQPGWDFRPATTFMPDPDHLWLA
jgi:hypothetical protein